MTGRSISEKKGLDWITVSVYLSLLIIGWLMLYATVYTEDSSLALFRLDTMMGKQSLWVMISIAVFIASLVIDWKFWLSFSYPIYFFGIILLILVLFLGVEIKGARSWFSVGGLSFQPAEFAKFGCCLGLAAILNYYKSDLTRRTTVWMAAAVILIPAILIALQPDMGSAVVFISFLIMLYRAGLSPSYYIIIGLFAAVFISSLAFNYQIVITGLLCLAYLMISANLMKKRYFILLSIVSVLGLSLIYSQNHAMIIMAVLLAGLVILSLYMWIIRKTQLGFILTPLVLFFSVFSIGTNYAFHQLLKPHQQDRVNVWLKPQECDPRGSLYNIIQSKLAIGSGGVAGKGYLKGDLTKLNYVPEQTTDFIFSTVGEEQGFIGGVAVIVLFMILLFRITQIAERAYNNFIRYYAYGVAGLIFIHFFINIGMTMGLMPVIGIPLPFLSKGGSALLVFSLMLGILLKMDLSRHRELFR